ncbi:hypothetical protein ElyMa_006224400 [Elysia marginata]|uniref:Uncharacterized protein n=1 Tax=Elysia marginata TaxID=1093978 RepID=A0AAV4H9F9_9GAST|nr:hypothetical protein ElyMa_006224400 [Elysia marginata]
MTQLLLCVGASGSSQQAGASSWGTRRSEQNINQTFPAGQKSSESMSKPPLRLMECCGKCWTTKVVSEEVVGKDKCVRDHNNFRILSTFVSLPSRKEIRKLPGHLHPNTKLVLCRLMTKCTRTNCCFPHGTEELTIWQWMLNNGVKSLRDVADKFGGVHRQPRSTAGNRTEPRGASANGAFFPQSRAENASGKRKSSEPSNFTRFN